MMNDYWKVSNAQNVETKTAISTASNGSIGVILGVGQFVLCAKQMTKMLDAEVRRGFVKLNEEYSNEYGLVTGVVYDEGFVPEGWAEGRVREYKGED